MSISLKEKYDDRQYGDWYEPDDICELCTEDIVLCGWVPDKYKNTFGGDLPHLVALGIFDKDRQEWDLSISDHLLRYTYSGSRPVMLSSILMTFS